MKISRRNVIIGVGAGAISLRTIASEAQLQSRPARNVWSLLPGVCAAPPWF